MIATTPSTRPRRRDTHRRDTPLPRPALEPRPIAPVNPHRHGGTVVFEVGFTSSMSGSNLELLRRQLGMTSHSEHKLPVDPNSPAVAQLEQDASLLLEHGPDEDHWVLQARTWGTPSARTVHDWHVRVAQVAHQLDPRVSIPDRMPIEPCAAPQRPVGRAANLRSAAVRRRLAGLP